MKKRVISAVVLLVISLSCVFISPITRVLFFAAAGARCAWELSVNLEKLKVGCSARVMMTYLLSQAILVIGKAPTVAYIICFIAAVYMALFSGVHRQGVSGGGAVCTVAALSYPCLLFVLIMRISVCDIWLETLLIGCVSTWVCDCFALLGGMKFGKHKLAPLVSPNKTVEGSVCGALSSVAAGFVLYYAFSFFSPIPLPVCLITSLIASTMGQVGDLAESLVKRMIGIKDFSDLIPGHGGMFDRADSLLFSIPTTYLCLTLAGFPM